MMFKNCFYLGKKHCVSITKANRFTLFKDIMAVYSENEIKSSEKFCVT
jgi:hypothetical protein